MFCKPIEIRSVWTSVLICSESSALALGPAPGRSCRCLASPWNVTNIGIRWRRGVWTCGMSLHVEVEHPERLIHSVSSTNSIIYIYTYILCIYYVYIYIFIYITIYTYIYIYQCLEWLEDVGWIGHGHETRFIGGVLKLPVRVSGCILLNCEACWETFFDLLDTPPILADGFS